MPADPCTNRTPEPGTVRTPATRHLGAKFAHLHGKTLGDCACGRTGLKLTARGNLPPHHKPAD
ncbi:hypothetical protein [Streptomyces megasporus]|uniref:hypothetical protein n=1 Tax=Streptomyces megasporus TaxID=44060 RepID=UPI0004E12725|nr:hypothetical protein [Streptomyces megasporus]